VSKTLSFDIYYDCSDLKRGCDSSVGIKTGYGLEGPEFDCRQCKNFSLLHSFQNDPAGHLTPVGKWDFFPGAKMTGV
jgi:hypothetical protein